MKTKSISFLLLAVSFGSLTLNAEARLGETLEQCKARYGEPVREMGGAYAFKKSGLLVVAEFYEGKASGILYQSTTLDTSGRTVALSDGEIEALLKAEGGDQEWEKVGADSEQAIWRTSGGAVAAVYHFKKRQLTVLTQEAMERAKAAQKAKADRAAAEKNRDWLNETPQQVEQRFGKAVKQATWDGLATNLVYEEGGFLINVAYLNGGAAQICYARKEGKLSQVEIDALLTATTGQSSWVKLSAEDSLKAGFGDNDCWARKDEKAFAVNLLKTGYTFAVTAVEYQRLLRKTASEKQQEDLKGF